ncbi:MAG: hypothetical protein DRI86_05630 [Bacteroidetes bacterium]|nr:MAG: hypothetical protein DRI86_05630 [Bacteroidota bacterium]
MNVIPFDQQEIETVLKEMLYNKGITDVLYEGSNISQISSVISYVISSLNLNTAINLQETLLPLATKRMNVLLGARQIGYEAQRKISYRYSLTLAPKMDLTDYLVGQDGLPVLDQAGNKIPDPNGRRVRMIPLVHNTEFNCNDKSYWYVGPTINDFWIVSNYDITKAETSGVEADKNKVFKNIQVKEGSMFTPREDEILSMHAENYQDGNSTHTKQDFLIPYKDVEEDGIRVFLTYVDDNGQIQERVPRYKSTQFLIDENFTVNEDRFVVVNNIILEYPVIFFQYGGFGNPIREGTLIETEILVSSGSEGEATGYFEVESDASSEYEVKEYKLVSKGQNEETNQSIKENAVVYHNTANRAVTKYDYTAIIKRHQLINQAASWGGEEEIPKERGHIWVSGTPFQERVIKYRKETNSQNFEIKIGYPDNVFNNDIPTLENWYLTTSTFNPDGSVDIKGEQETIIDYLDNYKMMTMQCHYRHPLYVDFNFVCDIVKYDISKSVEEINSGVFEEINKYFLNTIEKFNSEYINSNLQRIIDRKLSYKSGITYKIDVQGVLCSEMIDTFNSTLDTLETLTCPKRKNRTVIKCSLAFPFEDIFKSDGSTVTLDTSLVPRIDTDNFGVIQEKLWVDYEGLNTDFPNQNPNYKVTDIYLGQRKFGTYVVNRALGIIELTFEFLPDQPSLDNVYSVTPSQVFGEAYVSFNIEYPYTLDTSTNIPFIKNTIPRLHNVTFINN